MKPEGEKSSDLISDLVRPHAEAIEAKGQTVRSLAHYVVTVGMALKYQASDRDDLTALLGSLKATVLTFAGES